MWEFRRDDQQLCKPGAIAVSPFEKVANNNLIKSINGSSDEPGTPQHASAVPASVSSAKSSLTQRLSRLLTTPVSFRDVRLVTKEGPAPPTPGFEGQQDSLELMQLCTGVQKDKLVIIMVGLPGRGKTFLCNKLMRYLNWLGHCTRHFNVGQYRRRQRGEEEVQDASFFDHNNEVGQQRREAALLAALEDMQQWLETEEAQVAIFDATNTTEQRRQLLRHHFHGRWQYLMIESVCTDEEVLLSNCRNKMRYSPDYAGMDEEQALADFIERINKYEEVYEPMTDRSFHFIKLVDMVTGHGHMDINRISGFIPGKIVQFCMQVCRAARLSSGRKLLLSRHGESQFNVLKRLGGDSLLSDSGSAYADLLPHAILSRFPEGSEVSLSVWTSTLKRTIRTARHVPFPKLQWKALDEIDAGICDGMTYEEIAEQMPEEFKARKQDKLRYRYPSGESYMDLIQRLEPVILEMERERESICIVAHQAVLRVLYGYFMGVPLEKLPTIDIPLHTVIELVPRPDGQMAETRIPVDITGDASQFTPVQPECHAPMFAAPAAAATVGTACRQHAGPVAAALPATAGGVM